MKKEILEYLKSNNGYVSGQQLSSVFGVSRNAIWKHITDLKKQGYEIQSVTNKGYKIISTPDILNEFEIKNGLQTKNIGNEIVCLNEIDSTNEYIKKLARDGATSGLVCTAVYQTKGKGRLGRTWISSQKDNISFSVLLRPNISPMKVSSITLVTSLAILKSIKQTTGLDAKIKWPNDILINNKKVCGILTEMSAQIDMVDFIVLGIGLNVNNEFFDDEIKGKATSLFAQSGKKINKVSFLQNMLFEIEKYTDEFIKSASLNSFLEEYKKNCITLGREVLVNNLNGNISGIAFDINESGSLIIKLKNNENVEITSGEVTVQGIY